MRQRDNKFGNQLGVDQDIALFLLVTKLTHVKSARNNVNIRATPC
jgi:hypothetical protein